MVTANLPVRERDPSRLRLWQKHKEDEREGMGGEHLPFFLFTISSFHLFIAAATIISGMLLL